MSESFELARQIIEQQGIVALVLLLMMLQNRAERASLLAKNCEMSHYIMSVLDRCLPPGDKDIECTSDSPKSR